jgi:hypothetical protein
MWGNSRACIAWREKVKERDQLEELGIGGSIILKWVDLTGLECKSWTVLVWVRIGASGGAAVNAAMNLPVPQSAGNFLTN